MVRHEQTQPRRNIQMLRLSQDRDINISSAVAEMGDRSATIVMGRKVGAAVPFSVGGGSPSNTVSPWPRLILPPY